MAACYVAFSTKRNLEHLVVTISVSANVTGFVSNRAAFVYRDSEGEDDDSMDGDHRCTVTMAGVGPPPTGPECPAHAVLMEVRSSR